MLLWGNAFPHSKCAFVKSQYLSVLAFFICLFVERFSTSSEMLRIS